jgi:hypothetical protein
VPERHVRDEARETAADDRTGTVHRYFTEPASSPWTK